jgi:N-acetyl-gamma-glutamyl-phosphate reductase
MSSRMTTAVLGGSGFIGAELVRLLAGHPEADLAFVSSEAHAGQRLGRAVPGLRNASVAGHRLRALAELPKVDVAIACLPTGTLPECLEMVCERANLVLNVAGDYRLHDPAEVAAHYPASEGCRRAPVPYYVPEFSARPTGPVISLPGCMASAALYALYPLCHAGLIQPQVVVDAKTGSSGGGSHDGHEHPAVRDGNVRVHKLHGHRHEPEIRQALLDLTGAAVDLQFSAFSLPMARGVLVAAYSKLRDGAGLAQVRQAYARAYAGTPFVRVVSGSGAMSMPMLKTVTGSNVVEVGASVEGSRCVTVAALDNLIKGGAGQAVQALNKLHGLDERLGLPESAPWP